MKEYQLYPFRTRKNSTTCYLNAPWNIIPLDDLEKEGKMDFPRRCDFRRDGVDSCSLGCGAPEQGFKRSP